MLHDSQNQIKSPKLILQNSTKPFKNIISNYYKTTKGKKVKNKQLLIKNILTKIQKVEYEEKENEYFVNEVHRNIEIKKKIVNSFGLRAVNHYDDTKNYDVKIKIDKSKFLNPLKINTSNEPKILNTYDNCSYNSNNNNVRNKSLNVIKFPDIINKIKRKNNVKSMDKSVLNKSDSIIKINEYSFDNKNGYSENEHNKSNDTHSGKKIMTSLNNYNTSNNISVTSSKRSSLNILPVILNTPLKTERNYSCFKNKKSKNNLKKKNTLINIDYMNYIKNIREKSILEEEKKKKYFDNYKYGCDLFKLKYNFLKKKYFDK